MTSTSTFSSQLAAAADGFYVLAHLSTSPEGRLEQHQISSWIVAATSAAATIFSRIEATRASQYA